MDAARTRRYRRITRAQPRGLRLVVHDFSGHPFQVELSRALATRGYHVLHLHSADFQTPKGSLVVEEGDPPTFAVEGIELGEPFQKYSYLRRLRQERRYGQLLAARVEAFQPDVVISSNAPLDAQAILQDWTTRHGVAFVFWLQDIYSFAIERLLRKKVPVVGRLLASRYTKLEAAMLRRADAVVAITEDFMPPLARWRVPRTRISIIENWAPLKQVSVRPRDNACAVERGLVDERVFLYAGTLGLKHDPSILLELATRLPQSRVVVISEGIGAEWLRSHGADQANLEVLPYQPFERLSEVLGAADILVAILEPEAGAYSVPSKILTSLCAGRAILASIPLANLGARTIQMAGAGCVVEPGNREAFISAATRLLEDNARRAAAARAARDFAERRFDIDAISDRFERIVLDAMEHGG
jgi:colanic acid biosynthesis glycosyl transferase WcaI